MSKTRREKGFVSWKNREGGNRKDGARRGPQNSQEGSRKFAVAWRSVRERPWGKSGVQGGKGANCTLSKPNSGMRSRIEKMRKEDKGSGYWQIAHKTSVAKGLEGPGKNAGIRNRRRSSPKGEGQKREFQVLRKDKNLRQRSGEGHVRKARADVKKKEDESLNTLRKIFC